MPRIDDYDYFLPPELVAQHPLGERDASRLLVVRRDGGEMRHAGFRELAAALDENDVLVVNDTRVFPARLIGYKDSGGKVNCCSTTCRRPKPTAPSPRPLGPGPRTGGACESARS